MSYEWFKCYYAIKDSPKMLMLSDREFRLWVYLLVEANRSKERGVFEGPLDSLCKVFFTTQTKLSATLERFSSPQFDMIDVETDGEWYTITVKNLEKYQVRKPSDSCEATRERKRKQRDKSRDVTPMSRPVTPLDLDIEKEKDISLKPDGSRYTPEFEEVWAEYPRKVDKFAAFKAYRARRRERIPHDDILSAVRNYAASVADRKPEHIKHCSSFLGRDRSFEEYVSVPFDDDPPIVILKEGYGR